MERPKDVRTRLSFSSGKSPVFKRSLLSHKEQLVSSSSQQQHYWSRMGEFHMSRQNPDVLDHMYASRTTPTSKPPSHQQTRNFHRELIYTARKPRPHHVTVLKPYNGVSVDPHSNPQTSLLRQVLNARRAQSNSPSNSVVEFATRNGPVGRAGAGLLKRGVVSPMVVRLAGMTRERGGGGVGREKRWDGEGAMKFDRDEEDGRDPCEVEVVLDALRQKRKRWASPTPEKESTSSQDLAISPPTAKRYRPSDGVPSYPGRLSRSVGESQESRHPLTSAVPPLKSRTVSEEWPHQGVNFCEADEIGEADEIDEADEIGEADSEIGEADSEIGEADSEIGEADGEIGEAEEGECCEEDDRKAATQKSYGAGGRRKSSLKHALPLPSLVEEAKLKEKREQSLRVLKTVFTSKDGEKKESLRRKHPVFCGTGFRPQLCAPASSHLITQDDLRREREKTAAKLKEFFEGGDDEDNSGSSDPKTSKSESCSSGSFKVLSLPTTFVGVSSSSGGLVLSPAQCSPADGRSLTKSHVTKSVSFAPLPSPLVVTVSSLNTSTTTTASNGHVPNVDSSLCKSLTSNSPFQLVCPSVTTSSVLSLSTMASIGRNQLAFQSGSGLVQVTSSASEVLGTVSTRVKPIASAQSAPSLPLLAVSTKAAQQNRGVAIVSPSVVSLQSSQPCLLQSLQPQAIAQPSTCQQSLASDGLSLRPISQVNVQLSSFKQTPAATSQPSLFRQAPMAGTQQSLLQASLANPSLVQTTQPDAQVPPFQSSQTGIQHPLFQTLQASSQSLMPKPSLQTSQTGVPLSIFQNLQASSLQSSLVNQALVPSILPSVSQTSHATKQPFLFQASQSSQPSVFQACQVGTQPSMFKTSQAGIQSSLFQTVTSAKLSVQAPPVSAQALLLQTSVANPSLQQALQTNSQPSLFQTSVAKPSLQQALQTNSQPSIFQTSLAKPFQASKSNNQSTPLFQVSQANAQPSANSQPSLFQASQANAQPTLFQVSLANSQPSLFNVSQENAQQSVFQASQGSIQSNNTQPFTNTLAMQAQTNSLFTKTSSNMPTFFFGQNPENKSTGLTPSSQQQNSGSLFSHSTQNSPSTFNFSATQQPQLQQSASNTGLSIGTSQINSANSPFNFMQQNTATSLTSGLQQNSTFVFGQTAPGINFGGGLNQQQVKASVGFQAPQASVGFQAPQASVGFQAPQASLGFLAPQGGNIFNFSQGTAGSISPSGGGRTRNKSRAGKKK